MVEQPVLQTAVVSNDAIPLRLVNYPILHQNDLGLQSVATPVGNSE